jgi:hypothetical protein
MIKCLFHLGCVATIIGMPLTTLVARHDIVTASPFSFYCPLPLTTLQIDAWIFLVGALTSTATNVLFISVLVRFPTFLRHVKAEGADPVVVVRLATFYELNVGSFPLLIHCLFTSLWSVPTSMIARPDCVSISCSNSAARPRYRWHSQFTSNQRQPVVTFTNYVSSLPDTSIPHRFWSDTLLMVSAIGQFISSLITVMVRLFAQLFLHGTDTVVDILPTLFDQGKRLPAPPCLHAPTNRPDSRVRAVANTDAGTPDASYIIV